MGSPVKLRAASRAAQKTACLNFFAVSKFRIPVRHKKRFRLRGTLPSVLNAFGGNFDRQPDEARAHIRLFNNDSPHMPRAFGKIRKRAEGGNLAQVIVADAKRDT